MWRGRSYEKFVRPTQTQVGLSFYHASLVASCRISKYPAIQPQQSCVFPYVAIKSGPFADDFSLAFFHPQKKRNPHGICLRNLLALGFQCSPGRQCAPSDFPAWTRLSCPLSSPKEKPASSKITWYVVNPYFGTLYGDLILFFGLFCLARLTCSEPMSVSLAKCQEPVTC